MYFSTVTPNAMPRKVAMAIPKMPARIPGITIDGHSFAVAIPQAVVGPPTFALEAMSSSLRSNRNSLPNPRMTTRWTAIWMRENMKMLGAVLMTLHMFPLAPTTVKNNCKTSCLKNKLVQVNSTFNEVKYARLALWQVLCKCKRKTQNLSWKIIIKRNHAQRTTNVLNFKC